MSKRTPERRGVTPERRIHFFFEVSLWLKAIFAVSESIAGIAAFFVSQQILVGLVLWVTTDEFAEDPNDVIANFLVRSVEALSIGTKEFAGFYLLAHGAIKLWLIVGLLRQRLWYYPAAIVIFSLFIIYQLYRYAFTHSVWLLFVTLLDVIVIGLTWHEYRYLRRHAPVGIASQE